MKLIIFIGLVLCTNELVNSALIGGRTRYDLGDPKNLDKIEKLSKFGVEAIALQRMEEAQKNDVVSSNSNQDLKFNHRVISAQSQVVSGVNYYIKVKINDARCRRFCTVELCDLVIWERAWENSIKLTSYKCNPIKKSEFRPDSDHILPKKAKTHLVGQVKTVEMDEKSQAALDFMVRRINMGLNSSYLHKLKDVTEIKKQMVAGIKYHFKFLITETSCDKNENDLDSCLIESGKKTHECIGSVVDRVWMRERYSNVVYNCNSV